MNKMKLVLDDLQVESFAVQADEAGSGTVKALQGVGAETGYSLQLLYALPDRLRGILRLRVTAADTLCRR
jgi:hypothetical protein